MKTLIFIFFCLWLSLFSHAQILSVEKVKAVPQNDFYNTPDTTLIFPVFKMKNKTVENKINQKLKNDFIKARYFEKKVTSIRSMLEEASKDGLSDIDFEINHQTKKMISLNFQWGGYGAYPTTWRTYYCFNLETGNVITLDSLIEKTKMKQFLNLVKQKQQVNINVNKKTLSDLLRKKEIEKETYQWAMRSMKNICWDYYDPKNFTIDGNALTISIDCDYPHAIRGLSPDSDIKLPLKQIHQYLNNKYRSMIN